MFKRLVITVAAFFMLHTSINAATQPMPRKKDIGKISMFLIKPTEGMDKVPKGWKKRTDKTYGNCSLANESLTPENGKNKEIIVTRSKELPKSEYTVSICVRGKAKARIKGTEKWIKFDLKPANQYRWVELGKTKETKQVAVEIAYDGDHFIHYAGVCAEGNKLKINPVSKVWDKIKKGERVVVVLLGDSVTENYNGTGGGSSKFDTGNPGLMKAFLEKSSGKPVDYITHREPPTWKIGDVRSKMRNTDPAAWPELDDLPVGEFEGKKYLEARQPLDESKKIHLVNLGKGGADSSYSWSRLPSVVTELDYKINSKVLAKKGMPDQTVRYALGYYKPDLVIINFGTNDVNGAHTKWTVDDFIFSTKAIATNVQERFGCAVILSTPHKWNDGGHLMNHWEPLMVDKLRAYSKKSGFVLADVFKRYEIGKKDGIHPRDYGHNCIASAYIMAIKGKEQKAVSKPTITKSDLKISGGTVSNTKNGIMMLKDPNSLGTVKSHEEALEVIDKMNKEKKYGHSDWRLAKPEEIFPMIDQERRPALVKGAPFKNLAGYYYMQKTKKSWGKPRKTGFDFTIGIINTLGGSGDPMIGHVFPVRKAK